MSFHPNAVQGRARVASALLFLVFLFLAGSFFRTQVLQGARYVLQAETNRLREVPLPAPRGIILDRTGKIIAEDLPGYSISLLVRNEDSLRVMMRRIGEIVSVSPEQVGAAVRRFRREPTRPTVLFPDASFALVSVLEERRVEFPGLIIQSAPRRHYPDGPAVSALVGYTGEISESELEDTRFADYKPGQQVGKDGLERQYEDRLRGREGARFIEVDARGRVVREQARPDLEPERPAALYTNIDLDLQRFVHELFADSLIGGVVAMEPHSGEVLALHSAPTFDPNRFIGGIPRDYWDELQNDARRPLYNKAIKGAYPPGSIWKLHTAIIAMEAGQVRIDERMQVPCRGGYQYGNRFFRCWKRDGHGDVTLAEALEQSCDTYFYQLGLRIGLQNLVAGGLRLGARERSGIDLPAETRSVFPTDPAREYYDRLFGPRGWSTAVTLNLSIGQGENSQTVVNMARFYTALATDGEAARPEVVRGQAERAKLFNITPQQLEQLQDAMAGVISRGTAAASQLQGIAIAGKTGTAQNAQDQVRDHSWFVGYAPADDPKIVVALLLEFGGSGSRAARMASRVFEFYLKQRTTFASTTEGP
ncbi:penicillin-binding protein 2 [Pseudogemmatithrix spongiicola]|uniref:Penicillin-binding protein 2 n=1 Tax=Pseudogemmatithrix spongiicola TaxID=3062599 RepID=A0AA49K0J0_9BACT|nr:penicillin-binding protein 2 [Gemmatimonadaceae bacterium 'strain 138']WKW15260.1 penicillin-binding protein 2 [Gemmatimonadaceae bacterium 'strain 318']